VAPILILETIISVLGYVATFLSGLASGFVIEKLRLKYLAIKDNWNDLKNPIEKIYNVVRALHYDCDHAIKIRNTSADTMKTAAKRINQSLKIYRGWYKSFEDKGGIEKLDSIDEELGSAFVGISYFAIYSEGDPRYVESRLQSFHEITGSAEKRLDEFMKAKIPHYIILGKRKLANWRESRF
jgi:hypothetical protein